MSSGVRWRGARPMMEGMSMVSDNELILVVDDAPDTVEVLRRNLELNGYRVATARGIADALAVLDRRSVDLVITDLRMPGGTGLDLVRHVRENHRDTDVLMITGYPSVATAVSAVRSGATNYLAKPFTDEELLHAVRDALAVLRSRRVMTGRRAAKSTFRGIIGESAPMLALYELMDRASKSAASVLLRGEPGTGKELVARAIHYRSRRAEAPFVSVCCCAIPHERFESELFGRVDDRGRIEPGLARAAHHGAVFLDEVTAVSPENQERILRWLESGRITPIGGKRTSRVDVRVFAASDRNIDSLVQTGAFREALRYQLAVVDLVVPPLRDRGEDVWQLARSFAESASRELGREVPTFSERALVALREHAWPGNVRELATIIKRLVVLSDGPEIDVPDLPSLLRFSAAREPDAVRTLEAVEAEHIRKVLAAEGGNQSRAAEVLGIDRKTLRTKLKRSKQD